MATSFELGDNHPNSPSFDPEVEDGSWHPSEQELEAAGRRLIEQRAALDEAALSRIERAMLPLRLHRAGQRLDAAIQRFRRVRGDFAPHLAIDVRAFAEAEREKESADLAYRTLVEAATGQKWTDVARRLAA